MKEDSLSPLVNQGCRHDKAQNACHFHPNLEASTSARKVSVNDIRWSPSSWASKGETIFGMKKNDLNTQINQSRQIICIYIIIYKS